MVEYTVGCTGDGGGIVDRIGMDRIGRLTCSCGNDEVYLFQRDSCNAPSGICGECGHIFYMPNYLSGDLTVRESKMVSEFVAEIVRETWLRNR